MATSTTRFCIGGNRDCGVFHHGGGAAGDCAQELSMYGDKYIQCDEGYEPSAKFDSQSTPDGQGACLFTCQYVPPQCNVAGGHGTCKAGMADATTRFCIGGNRDCGVFHHGGGAAGDCTEETTAYAGNYVQCDDGYQPSAIFDAQSTPDGQGACLFSCEAVGPVPGPPTPPGPPSPHGSPGAGMSPLAVAAEEPVPPKSEAEAHQQRFL